MFNYQRVPRGMENIHFPLENHQQMAFFAIAAIAKKGMVTFFFRLFGFLQSGKPKNKKYRSYSSVAIETHPFELSPKQRGSCDRRSIPHNSYIPIAVGYNPWEM